MGIRKGEKRSWNIWCNRSEFKDKNINVRISARMKERISELKKKNIKSFEILEKGLEYFEKDE